MRQCDSNVRVKQPDRRIQLEERQGKHGRRRHPVGQQPEKQVIVAHEPVSAEGVGRRQRDAQTDGGVQHHIDQRIHIPHVPGRIGEDGDVVVKGQIAGKQRKLTQDLCVGLQAHVKQPVDWQQQEH